MHIDNSAGVPIIYVKATEFDNPEFIAKFDEAWASLTKETQSSSVQRDFLGQTCAVAPIVRMDKVMGSVFENMARRIVHEVLKDNYGEVFADEAVGDIPAQDKE